MLVSIAQGWYSIPSNVRPYHVDGTTVTFTDKSLRIKLTYPTRTMTMSVMDTKVFVGRFNETEWKKIEASFGTFKEAVAWIARAATAKPKQTPRIREILRGSSRTKRRIDRF